MKKNYITPVMKTVTLDSFDSLLSGSAMTLSVGDAFAEGEEGTADVKEDKVLGKNLWDNLW